MTAQTPPSQEKMPPPLINNDHETDDKALAIYAINIRKILKIFIICGPRSLEKRQFCF
jgi:hypothetical protein